MKRRDFVKTSLLATSGAVFVNSFMGCVNPALEKGSLDEIYKGFKNPPADARLFVRWWWNGNRLSEKEILRELDVMKAAGIGGVEINPIAFPSYADPAGYEALTIFTDEWLHMLDVALRGARERGLICDMIVGSGWPFGGEFLEKDEQTQMVTIETIDLPGGGKQSFKLEELLEKVDPEIHSRNETVYRDLLMARMLPRSSEVFTPGLDLMGDIKNGMLTIDVPEGQFVLYYVVKLTGYMAVINGAPGAAGPVLNHYSKAATESYLKRISGFINGKMGNMGDYIRAMFCDSMELEGANWNDDLPAEFEKRRGYSLDPYLPLVLKKVGHMGNPLDEEYGTRFSATVEEEIKRVRLDFYQTRIELFKERFIDTFNDWCHQNNVKSRMQAYGRGMHPLEASMEIDIPDCETWMFKDVGSEYPDMGLEGRAPRMCNKYVASGAALAGRKTVSCEEITNTAMAFMATLERIKIAGDQSNISGVNHSILHGFNYSPPEVEFPGWVRYGTYFSERNTWWPYFKNWSGYKARLSYLLQSASPLASVAILQPLTDLWLKYGPQRDPFPQKCYPDYQDNLWEAIHQNGGGCDYVSDNIINKSTFREGRMIYNDRSYTTLLLPDLETLDPETATSLAGFVESGGKLVFIGKKPFKSAVYQKGETKDADLRRMIEKLDGKENVFEYPAPTGDVIRWYGKMQTDLALHPYVNFDKTDKYLSQSSYELGGHRLCFIANTSIKKHISVKADFQVDNNLHPWIWNPESGKRLRYPTIGKRHKIQLELPRATSVLILFQSEKDGEEFQPMEDLKQGKSLDGTWQLQLNHMNGEQTQLGLDSLSNLAEIEETKEFAGEVIYEKTFNSDAANASYIDLGDVQGVSELSLNGQHLGTRWYGAHRYDIRTALREGENKISIKLTTIVGNHLKGLKESRVAQSWVGRQDYFPMGMMGPVKMY